MKKLARSLLSMPRTARSLGWHFLAFIAVVIVLSAVAGYQLVQITVRLNDFSLKRADQLMEIEESLDDAAIGLGRQIQEWKDMLLRVHDAEAYAAHRQGFIDSSVAVQQALLRAQGTMQDIGMDTHDIEQLAAEHKSLLTKYVVAHHKLDPRHSESSHAADRQVVGMDRDLQLHLGAVKAVVAQRARQHMSGSAPQAGRQYIMMGALGAAALAFMAFFGFAFAMRVQDGHGRPR